MILEDGIAKNEDSKGKKKSSLKRREMYKTDKRSFFFFGNDENKVDISYKKKKRESA